mmetsp:Transcript_18026/g.37511  ORF Transcript_18026/g.37511 Transcript_18026/m.37511 type:complete len:320 (-) Transcript_18026:52-1011(-)
MTLSTHAKLSSVRLSTKQYFFFVIACALCAFILTPSLPCFRVENAGTTAYMSTTAVPELTRAPTRAVDTVVPGKQEWKIEENTDAGKVKKTQEKSDKELAEQLRVFDPAHYPSCALVLNSGVLLKEERGAEIDEHSAVIRMNHAPTEGFESHVGSKTTHDAVHFAKQATNFDGANTSPGDVLINEKPDDVWGLAFPFWISFAGYIKAREKHEKFELAPADSLVKCRERVGLNVDTQWCSTGMLTLLWATEHCDEVTIYGGEFEPCWPFHYWDQLSLGDCEKKTLTSTLPDKNHDMEKEHALMNELITDEKVKVRFPSQV